MECAERSKVGNEMGERVQVGVCMALWAIVEVLGFVPNQIESHWRVLRRCVT